MIGKLHSLALIRKYGTRIDGNTASVLLRRPKTPFLNLKLVAACMFAGATLAYSEVLFEKYSDWTHLREDDHMLPVKLEFEMKNLPVYQNLTNLKQQKCWIKLQSWENLDRNVLEGTSNEVMVKAQVEYSKPSLTNNTLAKPGGILLKPAIFHNIHSGQTVSIVHMGYKLCGYPFIIHGGIIATLLNETFKRNASLSTSTQSELKDDYKIESLSISYRRPTFANQFLIVRTEEVEGESEDKQLVFLKSVIESQTGQTLVESEAVLRNTGRASRRSLEAQARKLAWF